MSYISSFETCPYSISCNNTSTNCFRKLYTFSSEIYNITLNQCERGKNKYSYCNVYDSLFSEEVTEMNCTKGDQIKNPTYPGGFCNSDDECIYGLCIDSKCQNKNKLIGNQNECEYNIDCSIGESCINNKCEELRSIGKECKNSFECKFNLICIDSKCENNFYFKDGTDITLYVKRYDSLPEVYCQSGGYYYIKETGKYFCDTLTNKDSSYLRCRETCEYKISNGTIINQDDKCLCGYNKNRNRYCALGNGEKIFKEFIDLKKEYLKNEDYIKYCHTVERLSDNFCIELRNQKRSVSFRRFVQKYNNARILAKEYPHLQDADECVKYTMFGYDTSPVIPDKMKCPIIKCDDSINYCFLSNNPFNEDGNGISVKLKNGICNNNEICYTDGYSFKNNKDNKNSLLFNNFEYNRLNRYNPYNEYNSYGLNEEESVLDPVFYNSELNGECIPIFEELSLEEINLNKEKEKKLKLKKEIKQSLRYPGEDCNDKDSFCIEGSICINDKCQGKKENEKCKENK
ncbi:MAG: hypothetical protein MJ252_04790, partial [archaeon]|nr:hypothetical protein [archaeon]